MNEQENDNSLDDVLRTPETIRETSTNGTENNLNLDNSSNRTTVVVIQTPSSINVNNNNENIK